MSTAATDLFAVNTEENLTHSRAATNAANAQLSCGPKTPEGKDRVKFNALKSVLFARTVVLPDEEQPAYEALGAHLTGQWQPRTDHERELVVAIQNAKWRINRAVTLEFSLHAIGAQQHLEAIDKQFGEQTPDARYALAQAAAYLTNARAFDQLSRQEGRFQRTLDRAQRELTLLTSMRIPTAPPPSKPVSAPVPISQNGFDPSKYPADMPIFAGPHMNDKRRRWLRQNGYKNLN